MKNKLFYMLFAAAFAAAPLWAQDDAVQSQDDTAEAQDLAPIEDSDEDWLNTMWTQVDDMVKEEEFKLQEIVTVAGVRGAEAEDNILTKLYYKGGKRYPSQDKLTKAIETLTKAVAEFLFDKGILGEGAPSPEFVGVSFPDGSVYGDEGNVKLRFDTTYMQMAADGAL